MGAPAPIQPMQPPVSSEFFKRRNPLEKMLNIESNNPVLDDLGRRQSEEPIESEASVQADMSAIRAAEERRRQLRLQESSKPGRGRRGNPSGVFNRGLSGSPTGTSLLGQ